MRGTYWVRCCGQLLAGLAFWVCQLSCAAVPYDPAEVQYLRAFLACDSMVTGKSNAEVIGADLDDPGTWAGVAWVDYDPYEPIDNPKVWLPYKHVLNLDFRQPLGGALEVNGFAYMQLCWIMNTGGSAGTRGKYTTIQVKNNPYLESVVLSYVEAGAVSISGNPKMTAAHFPASKIGVLQMDAPGLTTLRAYTLGEPLISLAAYPELRVLDLVGIDNVATLDVSACSKLELLAAGSMPNLKGIKWGGRMNLQGVELLDNPVLEYLDVRSGPQLSWLKCVDNYALTNLLAANNPLLEKVEVTGNPLLTALDLSQLPAVTMVECSQNKALKSLNLAGNPKLEGAYLNGNVLESLDCSGLTALNRLYATGNELTQFAASGVIFTNLSLSLNKLKSISANVAGNTVSVRAYGGGGYVDLDASPEATNLNLITVVLDCEGLPEPENTKFKEVKGSGLPAGFAWNERFPLAGSVDATFYFTTVAAFMDYFATEAENPYAEWGFGLIYPLTPLVGDPIGPMSPTPRPGFVLQGWYTDPEFTSEWDLEHDAVTGEMTLYPWRISLATPAVISSKRLTPASETLSTNTAVFQVKFNKVVSGVDLADFKLTASGSATGHIAQVSSSQGDTFNVRVDGIGGSGTLRLDVKSAGTQIVDAEGNALSGGYEKGESFQVTAPLNAAFADYLKAHGIEPGSAAGAWDADPDSDGLNNLMEFVLNGNPAAKDDTAKPLAQYRKTGDNPGFEYSFLKSSAANDAYSVYAEYSSDLAAWKKAANGENGVTITEQSQTESTKVIVNFGAQNARMYVRLKVESK